MDADDVWDGDHVTGSFVDISAQGVDVLTTFVDREDPSETVRFRGSLRVRKRQQPLHADRGWRGRTDQVAASGLGTQRSRRAAAGHGRLDQCGERPNLQGQLGAGRVSASAAVGSTARPRVISLVGLGDMEADTPDFRP